MPFVPVTVSRKNAAIVPGPSSWIVSSRLASAVSASSGGRCGPWYGSRTCTTPDIAGSFAQRRGSPVSVITPVVAPWYER